METLSIDTNKVKTLYSGASLELKESLKDIFGEQLFNRKITDRVKTFEDACEALGIKPEQALISSPIALEKDADSINAYGKLIIIARALNEGWTPDWTDTNEYKYYAWLEYKAGSGFSFYGYDFDRSATTVGSRLCFKSRELAKYAAQQFESIYNEFFNL